VRAYIAPDDPCAGLIPADSESPGAFQRVVDTGHGEFSCQKTGPSSSNR